MLTHNDPIPSTAHATADHWFRGVQYLAGEPWPLADKAAADIRAQRGAGRIEFGTAPASMAKRAADRRAAMAAAAKVKAEAEAAEAARIADAELEAATAPTPPAIDAKAPRGKPRG